MIDSNIKRVKGKSLNYGIKFILNRMYRYESIRRLVRQFSTIKTPDNWAFIVGCYNSGTTLLRRMIAAHPKVSSLIWEGATHTAVLKTPEELGWTRMWAECEAFVGKSSVHEPEESVRVKKDWMPWLNKKAGVYLEKSISNTARMEWLDKNFDNAVFIGIIRNGYCASAGIRHRARPKKFALEKLGSPRYPIELAGRQWVRSNQVMMESAQRVNTFHLIYYEDLIREPYTVLRKIWEILNIHSPKIRQNGNRFMIEDEVFHVQNLNPKSMAWLSPEDIAALNPVIGPMMKRHGYKLL